jgi:lysophospholipid acyltransferase
MPWIGFVFLMVHLSINHIARQAANTPAVIDVTGKSP